MTDEQQARSDLEFLMARGEFKRFLLRVIQLTGIFTRTTDGSDRRNLDFDEGRRSLGLEILEMAEAAQPQAPLPDIPATTLIQVLLEEARKPQEKPDGRRKPDRYDRQSELSDGDDAE